MCWHDGIWRVLEEHNIDNRLTEVIGSLFDEATSAALLNESVGDFSNDGGSTPRIPLSLVLFNIFLERIMQKFFPPQHPSGDDRFATCNSLTISICWLAMKKNSNNSLKDYRKQMQDTAWKSAPTKAKLSSTASSRDHLATFGWMENRWKTWASSNT